MLRRRALVLGGINSAFDFLTFALLLLVFGASAEPFRTGRFVESVLTEILVIFVLRTMLPLWQRRPDVKLMAAALATAALPLALPDLPGGAPLGFPPLSSGVLAALLTLALTTEAAKDRLGRHERSSSAREGPTVDAQSGQSSGTSSTVTVPTTRFIGTPMRRKSRKR